MTTAIKSTATKPGRGDVAVAERAPPSTGVQTAKVSADEAGMRVDRFLEARFGVAAPNIGAWRRAVTGDLTNCFDFQDPNGRWPPSGFGM